MVLNEVTIFKVEFLEGRGQAAEHEKPSMEGVRIDYRIVVQFVN